MRAKNNLVLVIKNHGLNGKRLSELTNISPAFISYIINGRVVPTDAELEKICAALGVTVDQIYPDNQLREALAE